MKLFIYPFTILASLFLSPLMAQESTTTNPNEDVVDFFILRGTEKSPWNQAETKVIAKVGQILRIHNDDLINHRLHTGGAPCDHGPEIFPGKTWDCVLSKTYKSEVNGLLYDHNFGPTARFFLEVNAL